MPSAPKLPDELPEELPEDLPGGLTDAPARARRPRQAPALRRRRKLAAVAPRPPSPGARRWRPTPLLAASAALHGAGLVTAVVAPGWVPAVAAVLVADHVAVTAAGLWPRSTLLGPNLRARPGPAGTGLRTVALTFDDGPDPEVTPRVLDVLERHGARASFFCVGARVAAYPELTAEIARRGHRVENHTHRHLNRFSVLGPGTQAREIDRAQETIAAATGRTPRLFRPPGGFRNALLEPILARRGLWLASWTRRGFDTVRRNPTRVLDALTPEADRLRGEILVLHDAGSARAPGGDPVVLEVLPRLLGRLGRAGLQPVPLEIPEHRGPRTVVRE